VLVIGQDMNGQPATSLTIPEYLGSHDGYQQGWNVLADPNWGKIDSIITPTSNGIPSHAVLDQDLVLRFSSSSSDFLYSAETKLIQILALQGL
jgi:hypothetical protein